MEAVYRALLPVGHPIAVFLQQHYAVMQAFDPGWHNYTTPFLELRALKGVFHLQWLSLRLTRYFAQHNQNLLAIFPPDPNKVVDCILKQTQWEPNLMDAFMLFYNLRAFMGLHSQ